MSSVWTSINGGLLTTHKQDGEGISRMFSVRDTLYALPDAHLHLTKKEAAQWAAVLNEYAEEAE